MTGILLIDKPPGPTSHDAVARARRALGVRRVGHFGTLDPFASGLLVLGVGGATRLAPYAAAHGKTYRAVVRLGARSTTDDPEGEIEERPEVPPPARAAVEAACERWIGAVEQVPPAYSAKHVGGARAYARARAGEAIVLPAAPVTIERIDILRYAWPRLEIEVDCGPGTYLRALARDVGEALAVGGYCEALRRTRSGPFTVDEAIGWDALGEPEPVRAALRPAEEAVSDLGLVQLAAPEARAAGQGRAVPVTGAEGAVRSVRMAGPAGFIGIGEARPGPRGTWVQPRTVLYPAGERAR